MTDPDSNLSVLFVCMGNICRSPAAEGLFLASLDASALSEKVHVDSAGTHGYHIGNPADHRMRETAAARGYQLTSRARQFAASDLEEFDLIVAMDRENLAGIDSIRKDFQGTIRSEICLLKRFLDDSWPNDVPDPYYGGQQGFEYVLDMIEEACPAMLDFFRGRIAE